MSQGLPNEIESLPVFLSPISSQFSLAEFLDQPASAQSMTTETTEAAQPACVSRRWHQCRHGPVGNRGIGRSYAAASATEVSGTAKGHASSHRTRPTSRGMAGTAFSIYVKSMPNATPFQLADVIIHRYELETKKAAITFARDAMKSDVRELLPVGDLDGNPGTRLFH